MQPPMMHPQQNVGTTKLTQLSNLKSPAVVKCYACQKVGTTFVKAEYGKGTIIWCLILSATIGCWYLPFCIKDCKDQIHYCSSCQAPLGIYEYKVC